jgi:hypothetical protein
MRIVLAIAAGETPIDVGRARVPHVVEGVGDTRSSEGLNEGPGHLSDPLFRMEPVAPSYLDAMTGRDYDTRSCPSFEMSQVESR